MFFNYYCYNNGNDNDNECELEHEQDMEENGNDNKAKGVSPLSPMKPHMYRCTLHFKKPPGLINYLENSLCPSLNCSDHKKFSFSSYI